jgi:hypothetical protein
VTIATVASRNDPNVWLQASRCPMSADTGNEDGSVPAGSLSTTFPHQSVVVYGKCRRPSRILGEQNAQAAERRKSYRSPTKSCSHSRDRH